jgi:hypothetical protein
MGEGPGVHQHDRTGNESAYVTVRNRTAAAQGKRRLRPPKALRICMSCVSRQIRHAFGR